jgi:hypothetical protein
VFRFALAGLEDVAALVGAPSEVDTDPRENRELLSSAPWLLSPPGRRWLFTLPEIARATVADEIGLSMEDEVLF